MRAGLLRETIVIQTSSNGQNDYGEVTKSWSTHATRRCQVVQKSRGGEGELAGAIREQADVEFVIRHLSTVTNDMRIVYDSVNYNILRVESDQWNKSTRILARIIK